MDIRPVYFVLIINCVHGRTVKDPCQTYQSVNKENIRNCLGRKEDKDDSLSKDDSFDTSGDSVYTNNNVTSDYLATLMGQMDKSSNVTMEVQLSDFAVSIFSKNKKGEERKMKTSMSNMLQYMLVPAFMMSGIMPWVLPKLQMVVMAVSMMNNMVFTSGLFALVRSYVFDKEPSEHVVYFNHGYKNKGHHHYG